VTAARRSCSHGELDVESPSLDVDLVDIAVEAESAGVDGVMVSDHVVLGLLRMRAARRSTFVTTRCPAIKIRDALASPYVLLAAIAARTASLRLVLAQLSRRFDIRSSRRRISARSIS